jgi:hypothetical protein
MKRLADLTIEDLTASPVWRFEGGSGEDAAVVAEPRDFLSQLDDEIFLAATEFTLPDSSQHLGFCFPVDDAGLDYLQPVIVTPTAHVRFWFDGLIAPEVLSAQWSALGKREEEIFPVRFRCRVPVDGRTVAGVIPHIETPASVSPACRNAPEFAGELLDRPRREDGARTGTRPSRLRRSLESRASISEKRTAPRHRVEMMVEFDDGGSRVSGVTREISRSGMFVRSPRLPNGGPAVNLTVHLPGGREILLKGRVVPNSAPADPAQSSGFGLRLTEKPDEYDDFLSRLLDPSK